MSHPRSTYASRRQVGAALLLALLLATGWGYAQLDVSGFEPMLEDRSSIRIIVELDLPVVPEGRLGSASIASQRAGIAATQASVLASLGPDAVQTSSYDALPLLALSVDKRSLAALASDPSVRAIYLDELRAPQLDVSVPQVGAPTLWSGGHDGSGYAVAVLDTGVDVTHPVFAGKTILEACFSSSYPMFDVFSACPGGGTTEIGSGSAMPDTDLDGHYHGTHVASIAVGAAAGNVPNGVAPGADLLAVQVFTRFESSDDCGDSAPCTYAYDSDILEGLEWVYEQRDVIDVVAANLSLGGNPVAPGACSNTYTSVVALLDSVDIAVVAATGNSGATNGISAPACTPGAVAVGATRGTGGSESIASYSNRSSEMDLLAPGTNILAALPGGTRGSLSGTSMATPHVAGAWAVARSAGILNVLNEFQRVGTTIGGYPRLNLTPLATPVTGANMAFFDAPTLSPTSVRVGDPVDVCASWGNAGTATATGTFVSIRGIFNPASSATQFTNDTTWTVTDPASGAKQMACLRVTNAAAAGTHTVQLSLDPNEDLEESSEEDNVATRTFTAVVPPANDDFAARLSLQGPSGSTTASNELASVEVGEPSHAGLPAERTLWWSWTAPAVGQVTFTTEGSSFDTVLAIYEGASLGSLTEVAANDDEDFDANLLTSEASFIATPGTTYVIVVGSYQYDAPEFGTIRLAWSLDAPSCDVPLSALRPVGDVDGDGVVTAADALRALRLATGSLSVPTATSATFRLADLNMDQAITEVDAGLVLDKATDLALAASLHVNPATLTIPSGEFACFILGNAGGGALPSVQVTASAGLFAQDATPAGAIHGAVYAVVNAGAGGGTVTVNGGPAGTRTVTITTP